MTATIRSKTWTLAAVLGFLVMSAHCSSASHDSGSGGATGSTSAAAGGAAASTGAVGDASTGAAGDASADAAGDASADAPDDGPVDAPSEGGMSLDPTPGHYKKTCDGSGAVSIDGAHFLDLNDETQKVRIYTQGANADPLQEIDISAGLGISTSDEADLEDAARVGNRVYGITSHGRDKNGNLETMRYKFFAFDIAGAVPNLSLTVAGAYSKLLADLLDASNWVTPNAAVISLLNSTSQLNQSKVPSLAPKDQGTNIEGLAALPTGGQIGKLVIGFRNPQSNSQAILVTLLNADAVVGGAKAQFGEAILVDLGGVGIRGMAWSDAHQAVLILSGPHDESDGPFALWKWSGIAGQAPMKVQDIVAPANSAPEAIVPYAGTKDIQVLFDMGSFQINGSDCKDVSASSQYFSDVVLHVD